MPGRNIANLDILDRVIGKMIENSRALDPVAKWLRVKFRKYVINEYDDVIEINEPVPEDVPGASWINPALDRREKVYYININGDKDRYTIGAEDFLCLYDWMTHAVDYLNYAILAAQNHQPIPAKFRFRDVMSLGIEDALNRADSWSAWIQKNADREEDLYGVNLVMVLPEGYRWVKVLSESALRREGSLMQHCVGGYYRSVEQGSSKIYSLRDEDNEPHVTVESRGSKVAQIKGKQNRPPVEKYHPMVRDLLNRLQLDTEGCYDARHCGFVKYKGQFYFLKDLPDSFWVSSSKDSTTFLQSLIKESNITTFRYALERKEQFARSPLNVQSLLEFALSCHGRSGGYYRTADGIAPIVDLLLKKGGKIPSSALVTALSNHHSAQTIRVLIERGASVPRDAIMTAVSKNLNAEVVSVLLKAGAEVPQGALTLAISTGYARETANLLIQYGANINEKYPSGALYATRRGCTPIAAAIIKKDNRMIEHLLQRGADVHTKDASGLNAIQQAVKTDDKAIIELVKHFRQGGQRKKKKKKKR
jgi:hypothetical protein